MYIKLSPKVGIVIPSFERLNYLKQTVKSALNQTYKNLEIIVIDDNSSSKELKKYLKKINNYPKIRSLINKTNLGTAKNYDKGVRLLSKNVDWVIILDNDDYLDRDFISQTIKTHLKYPQAQVIHGQQIFVDKLGKIIKDDLKFPLLESAEDYFILRSLGLREIRSSPLLFNLKQFKKIGGYPLFPSGMGTDSVFIFSLAYGNQLVFSKKAVIYIRVHKAAESETTANLIPKLISIKKMKSYIQNVYENNKNVKPEKKEQVFKSLSYYTYYLNSGLLVRKYKELVSNKPEIIKKELLKIIRLCKKNKIRIPLRFKLLFKFYNQYDINLQENIIYKYLISGFQRYKKIEIPIRHFLANKKDFFSYYKESFKKTFLGFYISTQFNTVVNFFKKRGKITSFKNCYSCGYYSFIYWDKKYASKLKKNVSKWGLGKDYTNMMVKRENYFCSYCKSNFRTRCHVLAILKSLGFSKTNKFYTYLKKNQSFKVYETADFWVFRNKKFNDLNNYIVSEYHPDLAWGEELNRVRNENLEKLTFKNNSFDLIISSEVLEHVTDLSKALKEINRVLKPKAFYIFTAPVDNSLDKTRQRAYKTKTGKIKHLLPVVFHGDDISSRVLAYRDFGTDIIKIIEKYGFKCIEDKYYQDNKYLFSVYLCQKI